MAERRMFAKAIVGSARFLRMPATSRLLYYDLGMAADDDGVAEAFSVMRITGATDDLVTYINDWRRNNFIRNDRYRPSVYRKLLCQVVLPDS